ncbi:glycosyltransferase [Clostridium sp.]
MENISEKMKKSIKESIAKNRLVEAKKLISEYEIIDSKDIYVNIFKAIILVIENKLEVAKEFLVNSLKIEPLNFDINYNLGYIYCEQKKLELSRFHYEKALEVCWDLDLRNDLINILRDSGPNFVERNRKKIVFFVKQGLDSFLVNIIKELSEEYDTKKIIVTDYAQIDEGMEWADICWFEWCDELVSYGSKLNIAKTKEIICRLHSYEAFTDYPTQVIFENVDKVIFVGEHIMNFAIDNFNLNKEKLMVIPNGIDCEKWSFANRQMGFNIAYVGYINYKKGPMLLLHTFKAIYDMDNRYKLFIAGQFQDHRDALYFNQMIKEFGIENNIIYEGWQDNLDRWLENKNYILCTSVLESQNMSVMQAMAKGIKPVIHNFVGAKNIYPRELVWNTIGEATNMIADEKYSSQEYHNFVENGFGLNDQIEKIKALIIKLLGIKSATKFYGPLVTIGITNYNGKRYLSKCVDSFINQTYSNIEILIVDDCSTDGSLEIIRNYENKYKNVTAIYHSENSGGASKGIQEIIRSSKGKYFQWLACDDFAQEDAIYKFVDYLEKNQDKDYVFSDLNIVNGNDIKTGEWNYKVYTPNEVVKYIFNSGSGLIPMNCLYRLSFFRDNNINWIVYRNNDFSADTLNSLQLIKNNWKYGKIDSAVLNYRIHSNNLSNNLRKRISTVVSVFDYIIKNFDVGVYMPEVMLEIKKDKFENITQFKNYNIAEFYYKQIQNHISMSAIPEYTKGNVTKEELIDYCYVLAEEGMKYIDEGLMQGDTYKSQLINLREMYNNYMREVKILRSET